MGKIVGLKSTESLLNSYDYTSLKSLKRALKQLLRLEEKSFRGNDAAMALLVDLKSSVGLYKNDKCILTPKQRRVIILCLVMDKSEVDCAEIMGVSQQSIHVLLKSGLRRVSKFLSGDKIEDVKQFPESQTRTIIDQYKMGKKPKEIARFLDTDLRRVQNKIRTLKRQGKLPKEAI